MKDASIQTLLELPRTHWRLRHLKCDGNQSVCTRCARKDISCIRSRDIKFRHESNPSMPKRGDSVLYKTDYDFSSNQHWCRIPQRLHFINETQESVSYYEAEEGCDDEFAGTADLSADPHPSPGHIITPHISPPVVASTTTSSENENVEQPEDCPFISSQRPDSLTELSESSSNQSSDPLIVLQVSARETSRVASFGGSIDYLPSPGDHTATNSGNFGNVNQAELRSSSASSAVVSSTAERLTRIYLGEPKWPLQGREEAILVRYFAENLAPSLDLCDPDRHFSLIVPHRAARSPILLNAILACSASYLSRVSGFDPYVSDKYHQECLKHLIPMLSDSAALMDENLLAATILLRYLEEVQVSLDGTESENHLLGSHVFITAQESFAVTPGLRQAAFWVGLRQEIYIAYITQRSILPALTHCNIDRSFEDAQDHTWANRIIVHCAEIIRYCYGNGPLSAAVYKQLIEYCDNWDHSKPSTFDPMFQKDAGEDNCFPEIWLLGTAVVTGLQHYHLARILLAAHNPTLPRLGPATKSALQRTDEEIKFHVRTVCGMALSNPEPPPNFINASIAIACAGDRFTNRREQEALLSILVKTQGVRAWPSQNTQTQLKEAWGWREAFNPV